MGAIAAKIAICKALKQIKRSSIKFVLLLLVNVAK
jgi:hypothetical protein